MRDDGILRDTIYIRLIIFKNMKKKIINKCRVCVCVALVHTYAYINPYERRIKMIVKPNSV